MSRKSNLIINITSVTTYAITLDMNYQQETVIYVIIKLNVDWTEISLPQLRFDHKSKCKRNDFEMTCNAKSN